MFKRFWATSHKGFTLIELMVVVAILGVLSAVAIPNVINMISSGDLAAAKSEAASVQTASDAYYTEKGVPAANTAALVNSDLFRGGLKGTYNILQTGSNIGQVTGTAYGTTGFTWDVPNNTWKK